MHSPIDVIRLVAPTCFTHLVRSSSTSYPTLVFYTSGIHTLSFYNRIDNFSPHFRICLTYPSTVLHSSEHKFGILSERRTIVCKGLEVLALTVLCVLLG
jgi:hypothetical protein